MPPLRSAQGRHKLKLHMKRVLLGLAFIASTAIGADEQNKLTITVEPLGDSESGVVARVAFRFAIPSDVPPGAPSLRNRPFRRRLAGTKSLCA